VASSGQKLKAWGRIGQGPGEFKRASAITVARDGRIYVGDADGRITIFNSDGDVLRTMRPELGRTGRISDLLVLPGGQLVVALAIMMEASEGTSKTYVAILDSMGNVIRPVLRARVTREFQRPLVGHLSNDVRLTQITGSKFGVWYPLDNYVDVVDTHGRHITSITGCFPLRNKASYVAQRRAGLGSQSAQPITAGVEIINDSTARVMSIHRKNGRKLLRVRIFVINRGEISARDYDIQQTPLVTRIEVVGERVLLGFNDIIPEAGVAQIILDN
jgi:hypothetical protein